MFKPALKIILFTLALLACGRDVKITERQLDPDTVEAIKKYNMNILQGTWVAKPTKDSYIEINVEGDQFQMNIVVDNQPTAYSSSDIQHIAPGKIRVIEKLDHCASKGTARILEFDSLDANAIAVPYRSEKMKFERTNIQFSARSSLCFI